MKDWKTWIACCVVTGIVAMGLIIDPMAVKSDTSLSTESDTNTLTTVTGTLEAPTGQVNGDSGTANGELGEGNRETGSAIAESGTVQDQPGQAGGETGVNIDGKETDEMTTDKMNTDEQREAQDQKLQSAHQYFAAALNGEVWNLLQKPDRSTAENERMVYAAHASCYHWLQVGTGVHHLRGEWLIAHVYTVLEMKEAAVRHAMRCFELTQEHKDLVADFDWAYAHEGVARANALAGNRDVAVQHRHLAEKFGNLINDEEDKKIFMSDFSGGNWFSL